MRITEVTVGIHQKKSHPYEYGNFDCEVRMTAAVGEDEDIDAVVKALREQAGGHVRSECALFLARVEKERERSYDDLEAAMRETEEEWEDAHLDEVEDGEGEVDEDEVPF